MKREQQMSTLASLADVSYTPQREYVSDWPCEYASNWPCEYASDSTKQVDQLYLNNIEPVYSDQNDNYARASSPAVCSCMIKGDIE